MKQFVDVRIMAEQETGEEVCLHNHIRCDYEAERLCNQAREDYPDYRDVWIERENSAPDFFDNEDY